MQPQRRPSEPPPQPRAAAAPGDRSRAGSVSARPADRVYIEEVNIAKATEKASTCFTSPGEEPNLDPETREARYPREAEGRVSSTPCPAHQRQDYGEPIPFQQQESYH